MFFGNLSETGRSTKIPHVGVLDIVIRNLLTLFGDSCSIIPIFDLCTFLANLVVTLLIACLVFLLFLLSYFTWGLT